MNRRYKIAFGLIVVGLLIVDIIGTSITNGVLKEAYRPYKGVVVVLDAGHGGKDDGAKFNSIKEQDLNLAIVLKLKPLLEEVGMKVILTREDENDLASADASNRKREDMAKRISIINEKDVDFFISVHMNSYADTSVKGSQLFYARGDEDSHVFASYLQERVTKITNSKMEIKSGDYYILKESNKIGVLLECGFMSNQEELNKLIDENYQADLVAALRGGLMDFLSTMYE